MPAALTSKLAYNYLDPAHLKAQHTTILACFRPGETLSDREIQIRTGMLSHVVPARRGELVDAGYLEYAGQERRLEHLRRVYRRVQRQTTLFDLPNPAHDPRQAGR